MLAPLYTLAYLVSIETCWQQRAVVMSRSKTQLRTSESSASQGAPNPTQLTLAKFLPYRLSVLSNRISNTIARAYSDQFNLTIPQWRVIAVLAEHATMTATQIAEATEMDKVTVSRAVSGLVERALLRRDESAIDGRSRILTLTRQGNSVHAAIAPMALEYEQTLVANLSASDRAHLDRLLQKLTDAANASPPPL